MLIGRITKDSSLSIRSEGDHRWRLLSFQLSGEALSEMIIPDSCYATPGRYVLELMRRLREHRTDCPVLVFNPLIDWNRVTLLGVLRFVWSAEHPGPITVYADKSNRPIAYRFSSDLNPKPLVSLVSTVDAEVDAELLRLVFGLPAQRVRTGMSGGLALYTRIHTAPIQKIYRWIAASAVKALSARSGDSDPPWAAIMPYHAGDALFLCLAHERTKTPITHVVVCKEYAEIFRRHAPTLVPIELDAPPPYRNGWKISEEDYFEHVKERLPSGNLYAYLRPSGDYNSTHWHLIDHFAFALGASPRSISDLVWDKPANRVKDTSFASWPIHVLLHFDAGWPLKIYPPEYQERLIQLLQENGYLVTVLGKADESRNGYSTVKFRSYGQLRDLVLSSHVVLGMDSFPIHLATHGFRVPSICLFSSTRPDNSNAPHTAGYTYLERGLACRPCLALERCPAYGEATCRNFVYPEDAYEAISKMVKDCYPEIEQLSHNAVFPQSRSRLVVTEGAASCKSPEVGRTNSLHWRWRIPSHVVDVRRLDKAIAIERLSPWNYIGPFGLLAQQFLQSSRQQGLWRAMRKGARFVVNQILHP